MGTIVVKIKTGLECISFKFDSWIEAAKFAGTAGDIVIPYKNKDGKEHDVEITIFAEKEDDNNGMDV